MDVFGYVFTHKFEGLVESIQLPLECLELPGCSELHLLDLVHLDKVAHEFVDLLDGSLAGLFTHYLIVPSYNLLALLI